MQSGTLKLAERLPGNKERLKMDHLEEAKEIIRGASDTNDRLDAIAHALIAVAERLGHL
jgi:hypothetical protein